jgi:TfoX/Sxy family transcriptional regulator of competence genes
MARIYLDKLQHTLESLARSLPTNAELVCKHFFSGAAAYANGRICITLTPVGLALKLPEDARAEFMAAGATPLRYFPNGPIKKDYVVVPPALVADAEGLEHWARKSIDYVLTLSRP